MNLKLSKFLLACMIAFLSVSAISALAAERPAELKIVDVMPTFWQYWQRAEGKPQSEQIAMFRQTVVEAHPELFTPNILGMARGEGFNEALDQRVSKLVADVPKLAPKMKQYELELQNRLPQYFSAFRGMYPDVQGPLTVYLMPSLNAFTGEQRPVNGRFSLLLGVDNIAANVSVEQFPPLVEHEMFHFYHFQKVHPFETIATEQGMPIYWWIWDEGFATYAAHLLNPTVSDREVFVSKTDLKQEVRPHVPHLAKLLLKSMDSTSPELYGELIVGGDKAADKLHAGLPGRSGYVLGYLLVETLAKKHTLVELASLRGDALRKALEEGLAELAKTAEPVPENAGTRPTT
jgi:Predicted Zn-dependent protease (DUF2268)